MLPDQTKSDSFTDFVDEVELRLRQALAAELGPELGRDASAEALVYFALLLAGWWGALRRSELTA